MPFRQQAATVIRIKETSAEQLDELTKSIREIETTITRKQTELKERVGETYLRGDDLKQYVNMLKAKSSVYKKQRAELSALEVSVFHAFSSFFLHLEFSTFSMSVRSAIVPRTDIINRTVKSKKWATLPECILNYVFLNGYFFFLITFHSFQLPI